MPAYNSSVKALIREVPAMGNGAQISVPAGASVPSGSDLTLLRRRAAIARIAALALALVLFTVLAWPTGGLALEPHTWLLRDQAGHNWSLTLLEQADPAYPGGLRLRLTDRSVSQRLDHQLPLRLSDGMGVDWDLGNRSEELVAAAGAALPDASAQFDLPQLEPRPRAELPLLLIAPLASGDQVRMVLTPAAVAALHATTGPSAPLGAHLNQPSKSRRGWDTPTDWVPFK
jgi:hypothetical protein